MPDETFDLYGDKIVIHLRERTCFSTDDVIDSALFKKILSRCLEDLKRKNSILLHIFGTLSLEEPNVTLLIKTLRVLLKNSCDHVPAIVPGSDVFLKDKYLFNDFLEYLYNYWRSIERFVVCDSSNRDYDQRPYRVFNDMVEPLSHLIRSAYRDIAENLTQTHPSIYRQVIAGAKVGSIASQKSLDLPSGCYDQLRQIPLIRQVLLYPPLILNSPMNKRTGKFERVNKNPLSVVTLKSDEWLCYPAKVGALVVLVYFHKKFSDLGFSLCNLFEMADDNDIKKKPDAVFIYGVEGNSLDDLCPKMPAVFYDDEANSLLVGAIPGKDQFGYFGYVKKMILTLHNITMIKRGRLPFHGAMVRMILKGNKDLTFVFIGDTGAGKSETLEAFRSLGEEYIQDIIIIADDMGSFEMAPEGIIGYGTEIGAFLRLDDLQPGYALGQIDRAIIMNANQVNARILLPVTTFHILGKGHKVDFVLYANNYEEIDDDHPIIERFATPETAIKVFKEGTVMSKGTTTTSGIVHSYYANIFGPVQYRSVHDGLSQKYFHAFFKAGLYVGQIRTRLGLTGWERQGPTEAARELLRVIQQP